MSASPAANGSGQTRPKEQITFQFCRECSNMLYPKEDEATNTLMFACRTCQFSEPATSSCVFRNQLNNSVGETAGVTQDVGADPTVILPSFFCLLCGEHITSETLEGNDEPPRKVDSTPSARPADPSRSRL
ncbi:MAG: Histone-lysine N-methyltransferase set9 [Chaenotheca gracillima]|nr:MAG: Histone-lysine N-methyltransferase set9 [Chaenotheca gracillima]